MALKRLYTPFEESMGDVPFSSYPRPQLVRDSFLCLNGAWELSRRSGDTVQSVGTVTVPFPPESAISSIEQTLDKNEEWIYERTFSFDASFVKDRVLLHIGAADQQATVYVNGIELLTHVGGYLPFSCDITDALRDGDNRLRIVVKDPLDEELPYGKQRVKRGGMWYTPISGIWQTVWCESVPSSYIQSLSVTPTLDSVTIAVVGGDEQKRLVIHTENGDQAYDFKGDHITVPIDHPHLWSPESPYLYAFTLQSGEDSVQSYFALRTVSVETVAGYPRMLLNGKPYLFHGLLDQGYFSDGIYVPATEEGYRFDVREMKKLGFNMLRKHIKIEPEVFYYECDRQGMLVFQDFVNSGKYSFLFDTALPTIGLRRGISHRASKRRRDVFEQTARDTVTHLYNHPCVVYYTIFNEGWGQYDADRIYRDMKRLDHTRIWDATSGWFAERDSDVQSEHIYFKPVKLKTGDRPLVLSEFGGYSCKIDGHAANLDKTYGYRTFDDPASFEEGLKTLYMNEIVPAVKEGLCAMVLTQVSDVEDEVNGLVTYDRQVCKVSEDTMRDIAVQLQQAFEDSLNE